VSIFRLRWKALATFVALVTVGASSMLVSDGTPAFAAKRVTVYAGAGQAGIAIELFLPNNVVINQGDTIDFVNPYEEPHTVTFEAGEAEIPNEQAPFNAAAAASFDGSQTIHSGFMGKDAKFSVTFAKTGAFEFLCVLHPGMTIDVAVVGAGVYTPPQGASVQGADQTIAAGIAAGEAASASALAAVNQQNAGARGSWTVKTGPSIPFEGATVDVMRFLPARLSVGVGDRVTWQNDTFLPHMVTFFAGPPPAGFDPFVTTRPSGDAFRPGTFYNIVISRNPAFGGVAETSLVFNQPGTYSYVCVIHADQGMAGVIEVGATGGGSAPGGAIRPPSTGDAGLLGQSDGAWMMYTGVAMLIASFFAAGGIAFVRRSE
jgi:plastocyanin